MKRRVWLSVFFCHLVIAAPNAWEVQQQRAQRMGNPYAEAMEDIMTQRNAMADDVKRWQAESFQPLLPEAQRTPAQVMMFTTLTLPDIALKQQLVQADRLGVPLILQGVLPDGFPATVARITGLLGLTVDEQGQPVGTEREGGFAIMPEWFTRFNIQAVPATIVIRAGRCDGVAPCGETDFDIVHGHLSLYDALDILVDGDVPDIAAQTLARRGE